MLKKLQITAAAALLLSGAAVAADSPALVSSIKDFSRYGVDAAILNDVSDFAIAQKVIDRDDALARQQSSVETGRKSSAGWEQQSDVRFLRLAGDVHAQAGGHAGDVLVGPLPEIVGHGQVLRVGSGVGEEWFKEHSGPRKRCRIVGYL